MEPWNAWRALQVNCTISVPSHSFNYRVVHFPQIQPGHPNDWASKLSSLVINFGTTKRHHTRIFYFKAIWRMGILVKLPFTDNAYCLLIIPSSSIQNSCTAVSSLTTLTRILIYIHKVNLKCVLLAHFGVHFLVGSKPKFGHSLKNNSN
jgi:hypothetical protein